MQKSEGPKSVLPEHILVAEDDQIQSHSLSLTLKRAGYSVTAVKDGHMALRKILSFKKEPRPVDLVITDIQMPRLTGTELIEEAPGKGLQGKGAKDLFSFCAQVDDFLMGGNPTHKESEKRVKELERVGVAQR